MDTILHYIELLKTKLATQTDSQKLLLTAAATVFALCLFFGGLLAFYWDGGNYIISTDNNHLYPKQDTHSGQNVEDPTNKGNESHPEKPAESH